MPRKRIEWVQWVGKKKPSPFKYGRQLLKFEESPEHGYRRVEQLLDQYDGERLCRMHYGDLATYDPYDPEISKENFGKRLLREKSYWAKWVKEQLDPPKEEPKKEEPKKPAKSHASKTPEKPAEEVVVPVNPEPTPTFEQELEQQATDDKAAGLPAQE